MNIEHGLLARWKRALEAATDTRLKPTDRAVLMVILDRLNDTGVAWPGLPLIATDAKVDRSTVVRSLRRLTDFGYLERVSGDRTTSNRYRMGRCNAAPRRGVAPRGEAAPRVGANRHLNVGAAPHPEPASFNLPIEPAQEPPGIADRFFEFWAAYPRKDAKPKAKTAWRAKKLDREADAILADLTQNGGRWKGVEPQFVPMPSTYLNGRRWEDESTRQKSACSELPRDSRSTDEINAANEQTLARLGGTHGS